MSLRAAKVDLGVLSTYRIGVNAYDQDKLGYGPLMLQHSGVNPEDNWAGPLPVGLGKPMEACGVSGQYPWVMRWSTTIDWIFLADLSTAGNTRRIMMYTYNRATGADPVYQGFITLTYSNATAHTIRALRMKYAKRTRGTAACSGSTVTGTGTQFVTDKICVGSRMGWPTVPGDASTVPAWYEIGSITDLDTLTLTTAPGTVADSAYIIEELQCLTLTTNATLANGGLYLTKGLRPEIFTGAGTTIPASVATDKIRSVSWLADAASPLLQVACGLGMEDEVDVNTHYVWAISVVANPVMYKWNVNAALTLNSGKDVTAIMLMTGSGGATTGSLTQTNNGRVVTPAHGPGAGVACFYFVTPTKVYRTVALSTIIAAATTWLSNSDFMIENPPGSANAFALMATFQSLEFASNIDRFLIFTAAMRAYISTYRIDTGQHDRIFLIDNKQINQTLADGMGLTPMPSYNAAAFSGWAEAGLLYLARTGTTAITNQLFVVPFGADWEYAVATGNELKLPRMALPDIDSLVQAFFSEIMVLGGATGTNLGLSTEPVRIYYRLTGINNDSGGWTLLDSTGKIAGGSAAYGQLKVQFRVSNTMLAARVLNAGFIYNDTGYGPSSYWQESVGESDVANAWFAWRFATAYGTVIPRLRIRLYNAISGALLDEDDSTTHAGTWAKSTNGGLGGGGSYGAWATDDKGNETTYLRWTPAAVSSVPVRAVLSEY